MSGINQFIKDKLSEMGNKTWITPDIDQKKLNNAVNAFKFDGEPTSIIGICDNTTFGSAKEGFILTGLKVVFKEVFESPVEIFYEEIESVDFVVDVTTNNKGKEKKSEYLRIITKDGRTIEAKYSSLVNLEKLAEILSSVISDYESYEEQNQLQPIEELSDSLKVAYLKIIVNMAFENDGEVDDAEFAEIMQLMSRLKLSVEARSEVRQYLSSLENLEPVSNLVGTIDSEAPDGMSKSLHISLVKDLISINSSLTSSVTSDFDFLQKNRDVFQVTDEQVELTQMAIVNDKKFLIEIILTLQ
ncbi:hypothetical protein [Marinospirillum minutulum]|uniref:hypothetical protein n=1 Tax=Marinospirillum minutulum TaxID=64974 RepID=UPI00041C1AE1|nr:hypothetical protein [Marinospirillum minutulum]